MGQSLKASLSATNRPSSVRSILTSALRLSEALVVGGLLRLSVVEGRVKMESGGMYRQALRQGMCVCVYG